MRFSGICAFSTAILLLTSTSGILAETSRSKGLVIGPTTPRVLGPTAAVLQMSEAGVETNVISAYIDSSAAPFGITSQDVLTLRTKGLSSDVIAAMLRHDAQIVQFSRTNPVPVSMPTVQATHEPYQTATPPMSYNEQGPQNVVPSEGGWPTGWIGGGFGGFGFDGVNRRAVKPVLATETVPPIPGTVPLIQPSFTPVRSGALARAQAQARSFSHSSSSKSKR